MAKGRPKKKAVSTPKVSNDVIKEKGILNEDGKTILKGVVTE